ncbi:MAG: undecaprenyl diphosphate synthase family protein [Candidatus Micrarchaeota archaeon]|nr:undecaprenyl diphosphate synthase family protein [Candidatus Micrarchaeota archaeon]MDE1847893.1 undecaprenyl diphosphate synthase family protein [Candidatus Micrarchaeota archaeon]MDE1864519.1 undecaprenyl diphosphate synthase family protein [Candidatus Micrarchaeota archaeon]
MGTSTELKHICFLMDGNRNYAIMENLASSNDNLDYHAYYNGAEALEKLMKMTFNELKVPYLTVNLIGRENCVKRDSSVRTITKLVPHFFGDIWIDFFKSNEIKVKFIGDLELFCNSSEDPEGLRLEIQKVEKLTQNFNKNHLILMAAYDPLYEYNTLFVKMHGKFALKIENLENYNKERESLVEAYYGFEVPKVNILIRTWWPKLSALIPILVGDHADIYLFPAPFELFNISIYRKIVEDYNNRTSSPDVEELLDKGIDAPIRNYRNEINNTKPVILGSIINDTWLPFKVD